MISWEARYGVSTTIVRALALAGQMQILTTENIAEGEQLAPYRNALRSWRTPHGRAPQNRMRVLAIFSSTRFPNQHQEAFLWKILEKDAKRG